MDDAWPAWCRDLNFARSWSMNTKNAMNTSNALAIYENIADLTTLMLQAVRAEDWNRLAELETACAALVEKISKQPHEPLTGPALDRKLSSIRKILAHDREIRDFMNPWMVRLTAMLEGKTPNTGYSFSKPPPQ